MSLVYQSQHGDRPVPSPSAEPPEPLPAARSTGASSRGRLAAHPQGDGRGSAEYLRIGRLPAAELEALMRRGQCPDLAALDGWEYRGTNTPVWSNLLGIKKFVKGFYIQRSRDTDRRDSDRHGVCFGYNEPVVQDGVERPWRALPEVDSPRRFGFYRVSAVDPTSVDNVYLGSALLDYGRGGNSVLDPSAGLRDYVVRVEDGSDQILLGKAYYALGPARVPVSYFVLERHRHTGWRREG